MTPAMRVNPAALEAIMGRSGLTPVTLAAACEPPIDRSYVANILADRRNPSAEVILRIAAALRVPVVAILANPESMDVAS